MDERKQEMHSQTDQDAPPLSQPNPANEPEAPTRRELIERYGKYAVVAAPLLIFVSKVKLFIVRLDIHGSPFHGPPGRVFFLQQAAFGIVVLRV